MEVSEIFLLGELFERVQLENIFPDGKTFVDCTPLISLTEIQKIYQDQSASDKFDLSEFINLYFKAPEQTSVIKNDHSLSIIDHIENLWTDLTRTPIKSNDSLIKLPFDYIIPGGRFREIYYWDSYFTMLGLQVSGKVDVIQKMVDNFAWLIDSFGYIPNGNRTYYLGRSQPPFFACMVQLLAEVKDQSIISGYLPQLVREYEFWMKPLRTVKLDNSATLNHFSDQYDTPRPESFKEDFHLSSNTSNPGIRCRHLRAAAESGWDFSSRWFEDENDFNTIHTTDIIPVDLNCLLYNLESLIAEGYKIDNNIPKSQEFLETAANRALAINNFCWNQEVGFYFDYDYKSATQKRSLTLSSCYCLFFKIADNKQAEAIRNIIEERFLCSGGLVTTLINTGQQWDAPNGWAPLQWIAIKGLFNYGFEDLAKDISHKWMTVNERVYNNTGKMMEKYNVMDESLLAGGGEYPAQDGFGWTNGVYLKLHSIFNNSTE